MVTLRFSFRKVIVIVSAVESSNPETLKFFCSSKVLRSGLTQPARGPRVVLYSLTLCVTAFTLS
jgi:hypothetical protein